MELAIRRGDAYGQILNLLIVICYASPIINIDYRGDKVGFLSLSV